MAPTRKRRAWPGTNLAAAALLLITLLATAAAQGDSPAVQTLTDAQQPPAVNVTDSTATGNNATTAAVNGSSTPPEKLPDAITITGQPIAPLAAPAVSVVAAPQQPAAAAVPEVAAPTIAPQAVVAENTPTTVPPDTKPQGAPEAVTTTPADAAAGTAAEGPVPPQEPPAPVSRRAAVLAALSAIRAADGGADVIPQAFDEWLMGHLPSDAPVPAGVPAPNGFKLLRALLARWEAINSRRSRAATAAAAKAAAGGPPPLPTDVVSMAAGMSVPADQLTDVLAGPNMTAMAAAGGLIRAAGAADEFATFCSNGGSTVDLLCNTKAKYPVSIDRLFKITYKEISVCDIAGDGVKSAIKKVKAVCNCGPLLSKALKESPELFQGKTQSLKTATSQSLTSLSALASCLTREGFAIQSNKEAQVSGFFNDDTRYDVCQGMCQSPCSYYPITYRCLCPSYQPSFSCEPPERWTWVWGRDIDLTVYIDLVGRIVIGIKTGNWQPFGQWFVDYAVEFKDRAIAGAKAEVQREITDTVNKYLGPIQNIANVMNNVPSLDKIYANPLKTTLQQYGCTGLNAACKAKYPYLFDATKYGRPVGFSVADRLNDLQSSYTNMVDKFATIKNAVAAVQDAKNAIEKIIDAAATDRRARDTTMWANYLSYFNSAATILEVASSMRALQDLENARKKLEKLGTGVSKDPVAEMNKYVFWSSRVFPTLIEEEAGNIRSKAPTAFKKDADLADAIVKAVVKPIRSALGVTLDSKGNNVYTAGALYDVVSKGVSSLPPKSSNPQSVYIRPTLRTRTGSITWNTWFSVVLDVPVPSTDKKWGVSFPTLKLERRTYTVPQPNEYRMGFAMAMSILDVRS